MTPSEIEAAREKYNYVPARLIRAGDYVAPDLTWKSLKLIMDVPTGWDVEHQKTRSQYSSFELDEFHRGLLQSENEEDLIHGLLSVVFWGFSSGVDGRLNTPRALSRAKAIVFGRKNAPPQSESEIIVHIKRSRELLLDWRGDQRLQCGVNLIASSLENIQLLGEFLRIGLIGKTGLHRLGQLQAISTLAEGVIQTR